MRKRNVNHVADTIFWYVIYMLPIILAVIQSFGVLNGLTFADWLEIYNNYSSSDFDFMHLLEQNLVALGCLNGGLVYDVLVSIFGDNGIMPLIFNNAIFGFAQWFVATLLIHLCVDFILFIPRLAHKWMNKLSCDD